MPCSARWKRENRVLQDTVNARVAAGRALPVEATMARQEAVQLADRRDQLIRERAQAQAALKRWVGDLADAPLAGAPPPLVADPAHLRENLEHHAELAVFQPMARMAAAEAREAEARKKGDWGWEVSFAKRGPAYSDMMSFQVSFELPLFASTRIDPQVLAKRKEVERIEAEREEMLRKHAEEIESELAEQEQLARQLARLRDTALPLAEERVRLLMASYEAGRTDLGRRAGRAAGACRNTAAGRSNGKPSWRSCGPGWPTSSRSTSHDTDAIAEDRRNRGCGGAGRRDRLRGRELARRARMRQGDDRGAAGAATPGDVKQSERQVLYWYDPMYPQQKFDKPGKSPFMDMQLVPKYADEVGGAGVKHRSHTRAEPRHAAGDGGAADHVHGPERGGHRRLQRARRCHRAGPHRRLRGAGLRPRARRRDPAPALRSPTCSSANGQERRPSFSP